MVRFFQSMGENLGYTYNGTIHGGKRKEQDHDVYATGLRAEPYLLLDRTQLNHRTEILHSRAANYSQWSNSAYYCKVPTLQCSVSRGSNTPVLHGHNVRLGRD